jgi:hypothetical protein
MLTPANKMMVTVNRIHILTAEYIEGGCQEPQHQLPEQQLSVLTVNEDRRVVRVWHTSSYLGERALITVDVPLESVHRSEFPVFQEVRLVVVIVIVSGFAFFAIIIHLDHIVVLLDILVRY